TDCSSTWRAEPTAQIVLAAENLGSRLLLGPGPHCATPPGFDFTAELLRFFDEHLRDAPPREPAPRVTWWLDGAPAGQEWRRGDRWPGARAPTETWYLAERDDGDLVLQMSKAEDARPAFQVDYAGGTGEYFASGVESQHGRRWRFTSGPLPRAPPLMGCPVVRPPITSHQPERIVFAYPEKLAPDDTASVIALGRL